MNNRCFVIQPFNEKYNARYEDTFEPAINDAGLEPYRVDRDDSSKNLIEDVEREIRDSEVVFAEISLDNPNVWYELGYAYACGKSVVMACCTDERTGKFPFDIQHKNVISYKLTSARDFDRLRSEVTKRLKAYRSSYSHGVQRLVTPPTCA